MKLILATDGSESAESAAELLARFNFGPDDEILILHVVSQIPYEDDYHLQIKQAIRRVAPKILKASANILQPVRATIRTLEMQGYPDDSIIEKALHYDCDLIVMGASGVKGLNKFFIGSATRSVAIKSPTSVLVVKHPEKQATDPMKVLFATDGSAFADTAGRFLASIPFPDDTELTIMNVAWSAVSDIPETLIMEVNDRMKAEAARVRSSIMKQSEKITEDAKGIFRNRFKTIHLTTRFGEPAQELLDAEQSLGIDIIAVGCRGLRGIRGIMGSVSRRILGHSACSVLIGKACE
jgi:nucleotide-binding universal stress UspA family protein